MSGVRAFGEKIKEWRALKGWTQEDLAEASGWDLRTISRAETSQRITPAALKDIAEALGLRFLEIAIPDFLPGEDPTFWLREMMEADMAGDFLNARRVGEALVRDLLFPDHPQYEEACVKLAIVCDHQGDWERALFVLNQCINERDPQAVPWVHYQRGLIQRVFAEHLLIHTCRTLTPAIRDLLKRAELDLNRVIETGKLDLSIAARHQLGVLELMAGNHEKAIESFQACLNLRESADVSKESSKPYRLAYEHRRIAQCHAHMSMSAETNADAKAAAREHFRMATELAREESHDRLLRDISRDLAAWAINEDETS